MERIARRHVGGQAQHQDVTQAHCCALSCISEKSSRKHTGKGAPEVELAPPRRAPRGGVQQGVGRKHHAKVAAHSHSTPRHKRSHTLRRHARCPPRTLGDSRAQPLAHVGLGRVAPQPGDQVFEGVPLTRAARSLACADSGRLRACRHREKNMHFILFCDDDW